MDNSYARYIQYLNKLKQPHVNAVRVDWLNPDGTVQKEITERVIQGGNITTQFQSGCRRTANITIDNSDGSFNVMPDKVWIGQKIRISMGVYLDDDLQDPYLIPQGVFVLANPVDQTYNPDTRTVSMALTDKWNSLERTLDGIYQLNSGDNMFDAIRGLLKIDMGNNEPLDSVEPLLPAYYIGRTTRVGYTRTVQTIDSTGATISGTEVYYRDVPEILAPYTQRFDASSTYAGIAMAISEMLVADIGYDNTGRLNIEPANTDQRDADLPIAFAFDTNSPELLGISYSFPIGEVFNDIRITGGTFNGVQASGHAVNEDPASGTAVSRIGRRTYYESKNGYTAANCQEYADYLLSRKCLLVANTTITSVPIYHMTNSRNIVSIEHDDKIEKYRVTGFNIPIGQTGSMSISAVKVY